MTTASTVSASTAPAPWTPPPGPHAAASVPEVVEIELYVLADLHRLLQREETALRKLDYAQIDAITEDKECIDRCLAELRRVRGQASGSVGAAQRERYAALHQEIQTLADRNNQRTTLCANTVRELLAALTGSGNTGYGRGAKAMATAGARPVLTSSVG